MKTIYLDHNATTPLMPEVAEAMAKCQAAGYGNPSSVHNPGRRARQALEDARDAIAALLGARLGGSQPDQLVFTSGGTESNNLVLAGLAGEIPSHGVVSAIEHRSVAEPAGALESRGWTIDRLAPSRGGIVDVEPLVDLLRPETRFVSLMLGNSETGVLQPVERAAEICRDAGVALHTDAAQAVGKLEVNFRALGVAAMSVSAHKFHGPVGVGALLVRGDVVLRPAWFGGSQQAGFRPGTEPLALVVGMHRALEIWNRERHARHERMTQLREQFEAALISGCPGLIIHGADSPRLPHTTNAYFPSADRQAMLIALDLAGVACSAGSACASGSTEPSPVLAAMGCEKAVLAGSLRFSLGSNTTREDVAEAADRIIQVYNDLRRGSTDRKSGAPPRSLRANSL